MATVGVKGLQTAISECNCDTQDYGISFYFRQAWRDPRLSFLPVNNNNKSEIRLRAGSWDKFWLPDTYFRNEKRASFHKVTVRNRLLRLNATGHMWYVIRYDLNPL